MARHDAKHSNTSKVSKRASRTSKQLQQTLLTTTPPLTQHPDSISTQTKKHKKPSFNTTLSSDDSSTDSLVHLQYSTSPTPNTDIMEEDTLSDATDQMNNTLDNLSVTRVDIKIKTPPSDTPEETTVYILQQFLMKLKSYDKKVSIAPWQQHSNNNPLCSHTDIPSRPSELQIYFPRIRYTKSGTTWYSGLRIIHEIPITDLRKDMLP